MSDLRSRVEKAGKKTKSAVSATSEKVRNGMRSSSASKKLPAASKIVSDTARSKQRNVARAASGSNSAVKKKLTGATFDMNTHGELRGSTKNGQVATAMRGAVKKGYPAASKKLDDAHRKFASNDAGTRLSAHASSVADITKNKAHRVKQQTNGSNSAIKRKVSSAAFDAGVWGENKKPKDYRRKK